MTYLSSTTCRIVEADKPEENSFHIAVEAAMDATQDRYLDRQSIRFALYLELGDRGYYALEEAR